MPERNTMKKIQELQQVKGDAYDYYIAGNEDTDLFEKIFLVDDIVEEICKPDKYFLVQKHSTTHREACNFISWKKPKIFTGFPHRISPQRCCKHEVSVRNSSR